MTRAVLLCTLLIGCGGSATTAPPPTTPAQPGPGSAAAASPAPASPAAPPVETGPALAVTNLAVKPVKQGDKFVVELSWSVTRTRELPDATVLFVHSSCRVGYANKHEDESVSGVAKIAAGQPRAYTLNAFASVGLSTDPSHCTVSFGHGPKGGGEEKLATFCWKDGAVRDGACG